MFRDATNRGQMCLSVSSTSRLMVKVRRLEDLVSQVQPGLDAINRRQDPFQKKKRGAHRRRGAVLFLKGIGSRPALLRTLKSPTLLLHVQC